MIYCFDLDNTICFTNGNDYLNSLPNQEIIDKINSLYSCGNTIKIFTARGMTTNKGDVTSVYNHLFLLTKNQLDDWGVNHHQLIMGKPSYDIFVDDKNLTISDFRNKYFPKRGFIAGAFDIIHPGYIEMFKECKRNCDSLIVGLHEDPSIERSYKIKPILSVDERITILSSIKYVDEIIVYQTEDELKNLIINENINILFLGDDYIDKVHNGILLNIHTHFINRNHGWSTTKLKNLIKQQ